MAKYLFTGAVGFIGSRFFREALDRGHDVVVVDALTYAGHTENLDGLKIGATDRYEFVNAQIQDHEGIEKLFARHSGFDGVAGG